VKGIGVTPQDSELAAANLLVVRVGAMLPASDSDHWPHIGQGGPPLGPVARDRLHHSRFPEASNRVTAAVVGHRARPAPMDATEPSLIGRYLITCSNAACRFNIRHPDCDPKILIAIPSPRGGACLELGPYSRHGESQARIHAQQALRGSHSRVGLGACGVCRIDRVVRLILFRNLACPPASQNSRDRSSSRER
jgi:hypothetical protein